MKREEKGKESGVKAPLLKTKRKKKGRRRRRAADTVWHIFGQAPLVYGPCQMFIR